MYKAQKQRPVRGDWTELVNNDLESTTMNEDPITSMDKKSAQAEIKKKIKEPTFEYIIKETENT